MLLDYLNTFSNICAGVSAVSFLLTLFFLFWASMFRREKISEGFYSAYRLFKNSFYYFKVFFFVSAITKIIVILVKGI